MYSYISSWVKPSRYNTPYSDVNLNDMLLSDILRDFNDGYIVLSNTGLSRPVYLDIHNLRRDKVPINLTKTLRGWLQSIDDLTLMASSTMPTYSTEQVLSRDATLAGFKIDLCEPNKDANTGASVGNKTNLFITNPLGRHNVLQTRVLTTVNGFLHLNRPYSTGIQVYDGGKSMLHAKSNNVGLISFEKIGDVQQIPIKAEHLHRYTPATPFNTTVMLDLDVSLVGKSIILSLGGYMFVAPSFTKIANDESGLLEINLSKIDIPLKLLKSYEFIDLSDAGIVEADPDNLSFGKIRISEVMSDVAIRKWLTLPQSFVIVVDTPVLTLERIPTQRTGLYGVFETHENPYLPLMDHYGRLPEYWAKQQHDAWIIQINNPIYKPHLYNLAVKTDIEFVNDIMPGRAQFLTPPTLLNIVSTRRVTA